MKESKTRITLEEATPQEFRSLATWGAMCILLITLFVTALVWLVV